MSLDVTSRDSQRAHRLDVHLDRADARDLKHQAFVNKNVKQPRGIRRISRPLAPVAPEVPKHSPAAQRDLQSHVKSISRANGIYRNDEEQARWQQNTFLIRKEQQETESSRTQSALRRFRDRRNHLTPRTCVETIRPTYRRI